MNVSLKSKVLVILQFMCMLFLLKGISWSATPLIVSLRVAGVFIALWGIVAGGITNFNIQPEVKAEKLIVKLPFSVIRNPMYLGLILFFGAEMIANFQLVRLVVYILLIIVLVIKIITEERYLLQKFGDEYVAFKKRSYRLIPFVY